MTDIFIDQISGRYDRPPSVVKRAVNLSTLDPRRDFILFTEVSGDARAAAAKKKGWTLCRDTRGDLGEVAFMSRDSRWEVEKHRTYVLGPDLGPGGRIVAIMVLVRHRKTNERVVLSVAHLPATVEGHWDGERAEAHRKAVDRWRRIFKAWRRAYQPDGEFAIADWNLNIHARWVREWVDEAWPALDIPPYWTKVPKGSTHAGGRLIDWYVARGMKTVSWRIMNWRWGSDHKANRIHLRLAA